MPARKPCCTSIRLGCGLEGMSLMKPDDRWDPHTHDSHGIDVSTGAYSVLAMRQYTCSAPCEEMRWSELQKLFNCSCHIRILTHNVLIQSPRSDEKLSASRNMSVGPTTNDSLFLPKACGSGLWSCRDQPPLEKQYDPLAVAFQLLLLQLITVSRRVVRGSLRDNRDCVILLEA